MKWRCGLIQRWLPEYPAGNLKPFWLNRVEAHLAVCPDCREELQQLTEAAALLKRHPLPEPEPEFWTEFSRELHLKLAQANQAEAEPRPVWRRLRLPYYVLGAAPALAILVLWAAGYLGHLSPSGQGPQMAAKPKQEVQQKAAPPTAVAKKEKAAPAPQQGSQTPEGEFDLAAHGKGGAGGNGNSENGYPGFVEGTWDDEDLPNWDVDSALAGLDRKEREAVAERLSSGRK